jgi:hydroxyquinol 1,2-dioxygenase
MSIADPSPSAPSLAQQQREQSVTDEATASFDGSLSPRFRELMQSLVRHLHAYAREVRLTEQEWEAAVGFLTATGQISDGRRQEFILLSDVLGLSMLTVAINAPASTGATESTVFGPFFVADAPEVGNGGDIGFGAKGAPCLVTGAIRDTDGQVVPHARIDVWEADEDGFYDVQYEGIRSAGRGWLTADDEGRYAVWSVRPSAYPIPADGPVGILLRAGGRGPMRPAHIHFMVTAPGYRRLITHLFTGGGEWLDNDAVFGVKQSLIVDFTEQPPGTAPDGRVLDVPWTQVHFDFILAAEPAGDAEAPGPERVGTRTAGPDSSNQATATS